jgi:hypothetical protein
MSIDKGKDAQGNRRDKKGFKEQKNGEPPVQGKIILYTVMQKTGKNYYKVFENCNVNTTETKMKHETLQDNRNGQLCLSFKKDEFLPLLCIRIRSDPRFFGQVRSWSGSQVWNRILPF